MLEEHLDMACAFEPLKDYFALYETRVTESEGENWALQQRVVGLEAGMQDMRATVEGLKRGLGDYYIPPVASTSQLGEPEVREQHHVRPTEIAPRPSATASILSSTVTPLPASISVPNLSQQITTVTASLASLSGSLTNLDQRLSSTLSAETMRIQEEINSMRNLLHSMRMQTHFTLMEVGKVVEGLNTVRGFQGIGMRTGMMMEDNGSAGSLSDDDLQAPLLTPGSPRFGFQHPLNNPMMVNFRNVNNQPMMAQQHLQQGPVAFPGNGMMMGNSGGGMMRPRRFSQQETKL